MGRTARRRHRRQPLDSESAQLEEWAKHGGRIKFAKKLKISLIGCGGRGVVAMEHIEADVDVVAVPLAEMITATTCIRDVHFSPVFQRIKATTCHRLIAAYLCYLLITRPPKWRVYLNSLPGRFTNPYFCREYRRLALVDEELLSEVEAQKEQIKSVYDEYKSAFEGCSFCESFTLPLYEYAYFAVETRSVYVDPRFVSSDDRISDAPTIALIPYVDMVNHSFHARTETRVETSKSGVPRFVLKTLTPAYRYNQLYVSYGCHGNLQLLLHYGFRLSGNHYTRLGFTMTEVIGEGGVDKEKYEYARRNGFEKDLYLDAGRGYSFNMKSLLFLLSSDRRSGRDAKIFSAEYSDIEEESISILGRRVLERKRKRISDNMDVLSGNDFFGDEILEMCALLLDDYICIIDGILNK